MVLISEIPEDAAPPVGAAPPKGDPDEPEKAPEAPHEPPGDPPDAPQPADLQPIPVADIYFKEGPSAPTGKTLYSENALRVAYIMRSYLYMRQAGSTEGSAAAEAAADAAAGVDRCRAMMEVVRKAEGRWSVSRVVLEHAHSISPPPDPAGALAAGRLVPTVGMEFDSISVAKAFYYTYSEKMGFKARTSSGRRSRVNRMLIMQRFLCCHGNHPPNSNAAGGGAAIRRKRGPYKTRYRKEGAKKDDDAVEVIQVESSSEKAGLAGEERGHEAESRIPGHMPRIPPQKFPIPKIPIPKIPIPRYYTPSVIHLEKNETETGKNETDDGKDDGKGKDGGKVPLVANPGQSRLLRELGIRVSRYTHEERRDIILKYMQKRNGRQVVDRSIKVPSRQALAERRQRGFGGKFLSKEEMETLNRQEETIEEEPEVPEEDIANAGGVPIVGMMFESEDKAYEYYIKYAANVGFSVRKGWWDKSRNVTRSRMYVCSREGFRPKNTANEARKPRPETRTGCAARMAIKITPSNKYRVTEFVPDHNHPLAAPLDIQIFRTQKLLAKAQSGSCQVASLIPADYRNYLRAKRMKAMQMGDAGAVLEYLQKMKGDNPSFYYAIQVDENDQMANVFWADAKSMMDYYYFGDVVCFDTTYRSNDYGRPFTLFIGTNHHKQTVIFGAAFLYDETVESFKWLLETFKTAMCGRQPKTILTDRSAAVSDAVTAVWPGTIQRHCVWQMYQDAVKNVSHVFESSETFAHDFTRCLYDFEEEEEFLTAWETMLDEYNLKDNEWLAKLYEEREKWALVYSRQTFCADMNSTLQGECFNSVLKEYLNPEIDLLRFFKQYERLVDERRYAELQADYHANQGNPRIPPLRLLWQAANAYTPAVFEMLRREFELSMDCMVYRGGEVGTLAEYGVAVKNKTKEHFVRYDSSDGVITCSCKKFEFTGIQCCHVLKVLDFRNVKDLPPQYILKRWRKDAKAGSLRENYGFMLDGDPKSSLSTRYSSLCRVLYKIAARAAENMEAFTLMVSQSDQLLDQVERILQTRFTEKPSTTNGLRSQPQNPVESESTHHENNEIEKVNGKKKKDGGARRRHQSGPEMNNKRQKVRKGHSDETEAPPSDNEPTAVPNSIPFQSRHPSNQFLAPSHFIQGPFIPGHQFGLAAGQGFHAMTQFSQDASASALHQQPFHGSAHLTQNAVQGYPTPDLQALQFVGSNPQLDHQGSDQAHCAIPVWDFL